MEFVDRALIRPGGFAAPVVTLEYLKDRDQNVHIGNNFDKEDLA